MQLPQPYIYTSQRMVALVDRPQMFAREGPIADTIYGYHSLWAAEVPFVPAHVGSEDGDFDTQTSNRLIRVLQRQVRFLYDLAQSSEHLATFELRLVSWVQPNGLVQVGMAFLGKTFHQDEQISRQRALNLWDKFSAIFPREAPFSYPLTPVEYLDTAVRPEMHTFQQWFEPLPFEELTAPQAIVELRKYEDWPTIRDVGGVLHARDYIPHPFVAALDYSAMARLFETMARQRQICMVAITVRPQRLTDQEIVILHELAGWYQKAALGEVQIDNPLVDVLRKLKSDIFESYTRSRAELGKKVYDDLVREHRSLFLVRLQVVGNPIAQDDIIEALGSEVMANAGSTYPSRWTRVETQPEELRWARFNLQWLEFARWGISRSVQQDLRIVRLRQLATVSEVAGAFRLPVASGSAGLAGVEVRDEPFSLPTTGPHQPQAHMKLGMLLDRGVPTALPCPLPLQSFMGISQIFGDANETRDTLVAQILHGMEEAGVAWILIRDLERAGETPLSEKLAAQHLLVDTTPNGGHALAIHPFMPPLGVSLAKFLDALLRIMLAVYQLEPAASAVLRQALHETYRASGWTEEQRGSPVNPATLAEHIETATRQTSLPHTLAEMLRTHCALPLRDLAATAGALFEAPCEQSERLLKPTVITVGWVGSDINRTFIQGCLWAWFTLALATRPGSTIGLQGIVVMENARTLFGRATSFPAGTASTSTLTPGNTFVGTMLIDERPDLLDPEIINRATTTFLTYNSSMIAIEQVGALLRIAPRQQTRLARLREGEALVAPRNAMPMLMML